MELYATAFDSIDRLGRLEAFASLNGPAFYGLPVNRGTLTLKRVARTIPDELPTGDGLVVPLAAGEQLEWTAAHSAVRLCFSSPSRSEDRRVGHECGTSCRPRLPPLPSQKKQKLLSTS